MKVVLKFTVSIVLIQKIVKYHLPTSTPGSRNNWRVSLQPWMGLTISQGNRLRIIFISRPPSLAAQVCPPQLPPRRSSQWPRWWRRWWCKVLSPYSYIINFPSKGVRRLNHPPPFGTRPILGIRRAPRADFSAPRNLAPSRGIEPPSQWLLWHDLSFWWLRASWRDWRIAAAWYWALSGTRTRISEHGPLAIRIWPFRRLYHLYHQGW